MLIGIIAKSQKVQKGDEFSEWFLFVFLIKTSLTNPEIWFQPIWLQVFPCVLYFVMYFILKSNLSYKKKMYYLILL